MMNPNQAQFGGSFQQPQQQPKGCLGRNWKWAVPLGCVTLLLVLAAVVGGIVFFAMSAVKSTDVYRGALKVAQSHPAAIERLGEPIKDGWFVKGNVKVDGGGGSADFEIPLSGPKNSGTLYVRAVSPSGAWMYERLDLSTEGGGTVSLLDRNVALPGRGAPVGAEGDTDSEEDADEDAATDDEDNASTPSSADVSTVSGGVLNGKTLSKPEPAYPSTARAVHATGVVTVQVTVDESGNVTSATAVSGHPLLQAAAVAAARQAKFSPPLLGGKPVKVTGVLTYNFAPESQ
jgi:TonB family protein